MSKSSFFTFFFEKMELNLSSYILVTTSIICAIAILVMCVKRITCDETTQQRFFGVRSQNRVLERVESDTSL